MKRTFTLVSILLILFSLARSRSESLFKKVLLERSGETVLVVTFAKHDDGQEEVRKCQFMTENDAIQEVLRSTPYADVQQATKDEIQEAIDDCSQYAASKRPIEEEPEGKRPTGEGDNSGTTEGYSGVPVVLPGTKWCGAGQRAKQIQDLGHWEYTDQCCRAHDLCDETMAPGETKNNLTNDSPFTKLSCQCDQEFYECLEKVDSLVSNSIGNLYFNILRRECYEFDHPRGACKSYRTFLKIACKEYGKDTSAAKIWQWVPPRRYTRVPLPLPAGTMTVDVDF